MVRNMTKGSPVKLLLAFALPLLVANVFQQLYSVADAMVLGRGVGVNALASSKISVGVPISVMSGREKMRLNAVMTAALIKPR